MQTLPVSSSIPLPGDADGTAGWDAINQALSGLYGSQAARHYGIASSWTLGGEDPLDGISVYWAALPRPHWHYVSYGLSELYGKDSDDAALSGFGFELTFRLAAMEGEDAASAPPVWPMNLMQNLARYVFGSGNAFQAGHSLNANGPISLDRPTCLRHVVFMPDPQLEPRDTPNGHLQFLQVVGVADEEADAMLRWSPDAVMHVLQPRMPLWITDLGRASLLDDPELAARVHAGSMAEGSSTGALYVATLDWSGGDGQTVELVMGATEAGNLATLLPLRLPFGRTLELVSSERSWLFETGLENRALLGPQHARFQLSPGSLGFLDNLMDSGGSTCALPDGTLVIRLKPAAGRSGQPPSLLRD